MSAAGAVAVFKKTGLVKVPDDVKVMRQRVETVNLRLNARIVRAYSAWKAEMHAAMLGEPDPAVGMVAAEEAREA